MRKTDLFNRNKNNCRKSAKVCPTNISKPLKSRYSTPDELTCRVWLKSKFRRFLHSNSALRWSPVITKNLVSLYNQFWSKYSYVHKLVIWICIFLGFQDPDPLVRGTDTDPAPDPSLFLMKVLSGLK
jgi:hypothetical protein